MSNSVTCHHCGFDKRAELRCRLYWRDPGDSEWHYVTGIRSKSEAKRRASAERFVCPKREFKLVVDATWEVGL